MDNNGARKTLPELLAVMAALRTPGTGCPWDLKQTFATIAPYKYPRAISFLEALPKTQTGKLQRFRLRDQA